MTRLMKPREIDAVVDIWFAASLQAHSFIPEAFWRAGRTAMRNEYLPGAETWVYEDDNKIVGFCSLAGERLAALFVSPEFQGAGVGTRLLNHAKSIRSRLELSVYVENQRAYAFYARRGFGSVRERIDPHSGQRETVMEFPNRLKP